MSHLYKLQIGLETITKTNYFVAFIIATSRGFNNSNQIYLLLCSYGQYDGDIYKTNKIGKRK